MGNVVYYFSTTGNSLVLARALAERLGGAELVSIPKVFGKTEPIKAERVGIIFPVYGWGPPRMVLEFAQGLKLTGKPYVYAVATCGGTSGRALHVLRAAFKRAGACLHAGFVCTEGANTVAEDPGIVRFVRGLNRRRYSSGVARLGEMAEVISARQSRKLEKSSLAANCFTTMMRGLMAMAGEQLKAYDKAYRTDGGCKGCGTCERVCPRGNVRLTDGKPVWHHDCEMCNACIQWCPQRAIHTGNDTKRYRNPEVKVSDLTVR